MGWYIDKTCLIVDDSSYDGYVFIHTPACSLYFISLVNIIIPITFDVCHTEKWYMAHKACCELSRNKRNELKKNFRKPVQSVVKQLLVHLRTSTFLSVTEEMGNFVFLQIIIFIIYQYLDSGHSIEWATWYYQSPGYAWFWASWQILMLFRPANPYSYRKITCGSRTFFFIQTIIVFPMNTMKVT